MADSIIQRRGRGPEAIVARGSNGTIEYAVRTDGSMEAKKFLGSPECRKWRPVLLAWFQMMVDQKPNDETVEPKALKKTVVREIVKGQVRIFCFRDGNAWVLKNGSLKKTMYTPKANIARAEKIMAEDLARRT